MKVTEMWKKKQPTVSFELFPARNAEAAEKLDRVIDQLAVTEPDFVSGSPRGRGLPGKAPGSWSQP